MAKNRPEPEKSVDTEEESGQEEESASSDDNGGSDSDSEPEPPLTEVCRTQVSKKPHKPEPKRVSSSEESDSESEADSDSNPNVKPIASKPMDDPKTPSAATPPTKKPRSKPAAAAKPTSPTKSAVGTKRPAAAADGEAKESKKSKKKPSAEAESSAKKSVTEDSKKKPLAEIENSAKKSSTEDPKKQLFQRLWSEEDEIAVLKGMIEYAEEKNADPTADLNAFHDFIRESLHIDVSRNQLKDKIRRLRKKYQNNARTDKKGKERTFSKSHDQNAFDLSKKIWGGHKSENGSVVKAVESSKANNASARKERIKSAAMGYTSADEVEDEEKGTNTNMDIDINVEGSKSTNSNGGSLFGRSLDELAEWIENNKACVSKEKLIEIEEKWKTLKLAEVELCLKRTALIHEQVKLVLDALK